MKLVALVPVLEAAWYDLERAMERVIGPGPLNARAIVDRLIREANLSAATTVALPDSAVQHRGDT
jgi:hypothetical protein